MEEAILKTTALFMRYHRTLALNDLNLALPKGKIVGLLGPNGSGKTTLIKLAAGLLTPTAGTITIGGQPIGTRTKAVVSYLPDRPCFGQGLTVNQQLDLFQDFYADFDRSRAETMLSALGIDPAARFRQLSKGTQEKVQLVLVMSRRAKLYLLDEPIGGVDPAARDYILNTIITNYDPSATVLISTHLIADVERVLDEFVFLYQGKVLRTGNADEAREETGKSLDELFREVFRCLPNC
ncbi:MAG: ABC transporter ATP-binding protein [Eubacteriales bacterium]|nr:ABC transporter ATP-binding protein [Eubacteriales bacterium]